MKPLVLYNTRTRSKEIFEPIEAGHARVYTCGPTVYAPQHIGNLRSQLLADLLKRALLAQDYRVTHVINITDVGHLTDDADAGEDKMERAAAERGKTAAEIAAQYTEQWLRDRERMGCLAPEVLCKATEHIAEQIALVEALERNGFSYRIDDGIYFDTSKFSRYAEFARLDLEAQLAEGRIGDVPGKRNPADFALWKFAAPDVRRQQEWDSPWGRGFPGWHIECSAMSRRYLGDQFDIHTGGVDHIGVHHTNEIAQSECADGVHPWVRFWLHNEFLNFRGEKMAKSTGNLYVLDDLSDRGIAPLAFRYFSLQAHYRQQQTFTDEAIESAATGYDRLVNHAAELREADGERRADKLEPLRERFWDAVWDDLNAPRALAVTWEAVRSEGLNPAERWALLSEFDAFLGLDLQNATPRSQTTESDPRIDGLLAEREAARARRDFAESDRIRDLLVEEGISIEDTPDGPRWRRG
ncbi:MAG: cysteine--tRNA ligase [Deltaproteobacteria bacterium]|nr:cysteine--tRNA ligase [Deltaproteobacteria bacterium]